jgi:hypothetical protein
MFPPSTFWVSCFQLERAEWRGSLLLWILHFPPINSILIFFMFEYFLLRLFHLPWHPDYSTQLSLAARDCLGEMLLRKDVLR